MTTRRASPGGEFASEKFASSAEFERGLVGSLVARRCTVLDEPKDKELVWFIHFLSHQPGGLKALAAALLANTPEHFGTAEMVKLARRAGQNFNAEQVKNIRAALPPEDKGKFPLHGETASELSASHRQAMHALRLRDLRDGGNDEKWIAAQQEEKAAAARHPNSYSVDTFLSLCRRAADNDLEDQLRNLCLDPACEPETFQPWYFAGLVKALRNYFQQWTAARGEGLVITAIGQEIIETLEYTAYSRSLTLIEGNARIGKSFAARTWCELHSGQARFIEVPPGNDETSFFRALARGLGIGNFAQYKAIAIRERVESVLLTGDLLICLDEAWRLWPQQRETRFGYPRRVNWIMSMVNQGVPICLVSTPQFLTMLKEAEEKGGWNSAQCQGRLGHRTSLPGELSMDDLIEVAGALLPEADNKTLRAIADYARSSARYLAAIETISTRARYLASRAGRDTAEADDVRRAMEESVIPSDSNLVRVLESKPPRAGRKQMAAPLPDAGSADAVPLPAVNRTRKTAVELAASARAQTLVHTPTL